MIVAGNKIYERCLACGDLVQLNKFMLGSLHSCISPEKRSVRREIKPKPELTEEEKRQRSMLGGGIGMMTPEAMEAGNRQMQLMNEYMEKKINDK